MLFNGEHVGNGRGPAVRHRGRPDRRHLADRRRPPERALGDRGRPTAARMLDASTVFYMDKLVTGPAGVGVVDIRLPDRREHPPARRRRRASRSTRWSSSVLDRPRHEQLIDDIRAAGAGTRLMLDGDVAGGINAARHNARTDMCVGIGGSPEGIVTACAIKALGGHIQGRLWPRDDDEKQKGADAGSSSTATSTRPTNSSRGEQHVLRRHRRHRRRARRRRAPRGRFICTESVVLRGRFGHAPPHRRRSTSPRSGSRPRLIDARSTCGDDVVAVTAQL